ncbi:MAG: DUF4157 domain-containing protein [Leptolyngbyaceae cyanobacterium MO_188.B28]|nr:DUF4157 domain-containing protein [Leptolyngbyaceae cyanobacterium MO_188.B28]
MADSMKVPDTSRLPVVVPKAKKKSGGAPNFAEIQRQIEAEWDEPMEMPSYSPVMANRAAANLLGFLAQQETPEDQVSTGSGVDSATADPRIQASSLNAPTVQRVCADCAEEQATEEEKTAVQPKLAIGQVGDPYEQEADQVAQQVVNSLHTQQSPPVSSEAPSVAPPQRLPGEPAVADITVMRRGVGGATDVSADVEARIQRSRGLGQPLGESVREPMEQAFGADFGGVRIHTDAESHELNQAVQAKAFMTGRDIYFQRGAYEPGSRGGQELLAHELTHVVQQAGTLQTKLNYRSTPSQVSKSTLDRRVQRQIPEKSANVSEIKLLPGKTYEVTSDDMSQGEDEGWNNIARNNGMLPATLKLFNQHIKTVDFFGVKVPYLVETTTLGEGTEIYIPSADELSFLEFRKKYPTYQEAVNKYGAYLNTSGQKIIRKARQRASGKIGKSYGTDSDTFLTPNKELGGTSSRKTETIDSQKEYKVNWGSDLWKCNIFMHDTVYSAGYVPHLSSNKHYTTAGKLHKSKKYKQIKVSNAKPGSLVQLYGGTGSNASHNMVLSSFVERIDHGDGTEHWKFSAIGAEQERSAESIREHDVNPDESGDFYKVTDGKRDFIRFFEPKHSR